MNSDRIFASACLFVAAALSACAGNPAPMADSAPVFTRPLGGKSLVRLAENGPIGQIHIIARVEDEGREAPSAAQPSDQVARATALWRAIRDGAVGKAVAWSNERTGNRGAAEILREVAIPDSDRFCREYRQTAVIDGHIETDLGQACQQRDGNWWKIHG